MIKTIVAKTPEDLDKGVNDFMASKQRNLPVRDGCEQMPDGSMLYRAMVFFDENFKVVDSNGEATGETTTGKPEKIGALWIQKDKSISGEVRKAKIKITPEVKEKLVYLGVADKLELTMKDEIVTVFRNKYKKEDKHPDFLIYTK